MAITAIIEHDDLAVCPFCGSIDQNTSSNGIDSYFVVCGNCGAEGPTKDTEREAIEAWFMRHVRSE